MVALEALASPGLAMPECTCTLEDVATEWAREREVITRLTKHGRVILSPNDKDLKNCNKHASYNSVVLKPLLQRMALQPDWGLFSLPEITAQLLNCSHRSFTFSCFVKTHAYISHIMFCAWVRLHM